MKVENNKDDVLSKGYPVSKMLIVLSTVFICQDSQRACIHFVCSKQMGSLSLSVLSLALSLFLSVYTCAHKRVCLMQLCAFIHADVVRLWCAHSMCRSVPEIHDQSAGLHIFACNDPIAHCKKREIAFSSEGDVSNNVMMGGTQRIRILSQYVTLTLPYTEKLNMASLDY